MHMYPIGYFEYNSKSVLPTYNLNELMTMAKPEPLKPVTKYYGLRVDQRGPYANYVSSLRDPSYQKQLDDIPADHLRAPGGEKKQAYARLQQIGREFEPIPENQLSRSSVDVSETYERQIATSDNEDV